MMLRYAMLGLLGGGLALGADPVALSGLTMGTKWAVGFMPPVHPFEVKAIEGGIQSRLDRLEQIFSTYRPNSELMRFNASAGGVWVDVSDELAHVVIESRRLSEMTAGAFDPTVLPLIELWGFGPAVSRNTLPSGREIEAARVLVDWRRLEARAAAPALRKADARVRVDLSSMAKGFASDAVSELLQKAGIVDHLVQVGGDVKAAGRGPTGNGWRVAIERADGSTAADPARLVDEAVSTSGNYRNFVMIDGQSYGHILDPRTGKPVQTSLASVSVLHASCAMSSGWATALFVAGGGDGIRIAEREHLAALFVVREGGDLVSRPTSAYVLRK